MIPGAALHWIFAFFESLSQSLGCCVSESTSGKGHKYCPFNSSLQLTFLTGSCIVSTNGKVSNYLGLDKSLQKMYLGFLLSH